MIGRGSEAAAVARFVERVPSGPVALVIEGEAGIGKTTVLVEAVREAGARGCGVLEARPAQAESELSYTALDDLVGGVFDEVSTELPPPQRKALEIALLRREADTPADPRTTGIAFVSVLTHLAANRPLVVAVDDVQWLDRASSRVLEFAARRLPERVGIVVTRRAEAGDAAPLGLDRALGEACERLVVGPLSLAALHHLIEGTAATKLPRPMLARVEEVSGGNPFYALELARALARDGGHPGIGQPLPMPQNLQDVVSERVQRLSATAQAVTLIAAAHARPTAVTVAAALESDDDAEAALLEAEEAGILVGDGERLRFSHPLLESAIYGSATTVRRRQLHRRLADIVTDPEERARHLGRGVTGVDEALAAEIERGASLADRRGAPEAATELYAAACRLTPADRRDDLARRLLGGANALATAGDLDGASTLAATASETAPPGPLRARALLLRGSLATYTESLDARIDHHERALVEAGDDLPLRAEILLARQEEVSVDPRQAARYADEAIALVRALDDRSGLGQALMNKFIAEAVLGLGARQELLDEALALEARSDGPALVWPLIWFHWIDDLEATRARYRVNDRMCRDHGDTVGAAEVVEFLAMAEFRAGNWDIAESALEDACATLEQWDVRGPLVASFADRSLIDAHRGRFERARATLNDILEPGEQLDLFWRMVCRSALGQVEFFDDNHEAADRVWTQMKRDADELGWKDILEDRSEPDHVEALLALGQLERARRVHQHLEWRGRTLPRPWIDATLPRVRALVLAAEGDLIGARDELETVATAHALPFERARLLLVKGQIERRTNQKLAAKRSLTEALSILEQLGSPAWAARARDEIGRLGLRQRPPDELTATERRIAELAAGGMTNREVAEAAFVSPKTVEANLARVYRKLGIRSRAELGARMSHEPRDG